MREHPLVDVDSHVLEPMSVWQDYLEPDLKPRAIRWSTDDNGRELMLIDGKPARQFMLRNGWMGSPEVPGGRAFEDRVTTSLGAANGADRVRMLDGEGIDITLLYPTLGIQWETRVRGLQARRRPRPRLQLLDRRPLQTPLRPPGSRGPRRRLGRPGGSGGAGAGRGAWGQGRHGQRQAHQRHPLRRPLL